MTAKVISLCDYRKSKDAEKRSRNVRGLGFPNDFDPFGGPDDFEILGLNLELDNPLFPYQTDAPIEGISLTIHKEEDEE